MPDLIEVEGGTMRLNFHAGQMRAWESQRRFVGVVAGTQSGKTSFMPLWLWREIQLRGPGDYAVICPTFPLMEVKALPEFKKTFDSLLQLGSYTGSPVRRFRVSEEGEVRLFGTKQQTPTQIFFGYATNPESLESATYKGAVLDEAGQKAFRRESWEAILRRLSIHQGRVLITTTPYGMGGWIKTEIYDRWRKGDPGVDFIQFSSITNPSFPKEEFERAQQTMPRWKFDLFYMGRFSKPAGMIYDCFDENLHTCPRFPIPPNWLRFVGLDFGGVNTAAVFLAMEPRKVAGQPCRLFLYREYLAGSRTAREHAAELVKDEPRMPIAVGGSLSEGQWRSEFAAGQLPVREPAIRDVEVGIDRVYGAIKRNELIVFSDCIGVLDEIGSYSREVDEFGNPTEKIEAKETYHHLDALRYIVSSGCFGAPAAPQPLPDPATKRPMWWTR